MRTLLKKMARVATMGDPHESRTAPPVTADSIAKAKQHRDEERRKVWEQTGIRITDDGRLVRQMYRAHCVRTGCTFVCSAKTEERAIAALANHLVGAHLRAVRS